MYMYALSVLFPLLVLQAITFEHLKTEGQFLSNSSTLIFYLHFGLLGSCRLGFTGSSVSMTLLYIADNTTSTLHSELFASREFGGFASAIKISGLNLSDSGILRL